MNAKYIIKPKSGHPYNSIDLTVAHPSAGKPSIAQRGEVMLNVLHNNGMITPLPFYNSEIQEVQ